MKTLCSRLTRNRLLALCAASLLLACVAVVSSVDAGFSEQTKTQTAVTSVAPPEKTVEQTQKNIQVLTGLPASQLIPVMNYMGSSLGVKCTFCHVNKDGNWDFPSDEKPEKSTAREMIKMVQ